MNNYVFVGNDETSSQFLRTLSADKYPSLIITGEDRKSGRRRKTKESPLADFACEYGINLIKTGKKINQELIDQLKNGKYDYFLIFSYGYILEKIFIDLPKKMSVNIHPSLIPKLRGAAPINRAIMNGDKETGVTFFKMNEKMDAGPVIMQESCEIEDNMTSIELKEKLISIASQMFVSFDWSKSFPLIEQNENKVTFAKKITKDDLLYSKNYSAKELNNRINGLSEFGIKAFLNNKQIKLRQSKLIEKTSSNGKSILTVENGRIILYTNNGSLEILKIQLSGKKIMSNKDFLNGNKIISGDKLCAEYSE
ncbi:methionyl-tRNA formyltransferase [candidate division WOR-3 bacterium]|nr:methionyl-tRNA formyltransferase [candidate division WOR-3 bacterium]